MKPTTDELEMALDVAERMRDADIDSYYLAKSLLYLDQRNQLLEKVLEHVELFIQFGLPEDEHARLVLLLEEIRKKETHESGVETSDMGLAGQE